MKLLKAMLGEAAEEPSIRVMIHNAVCKFEPGRDHAVVHASDLTDKDFCPRRFALMDITGVKPKGQFLTTAQRITYAYGHFLQQKLNEDWLRDVMYGEWVCPNCSHQEPFGLRPKAPCPKCYRHLWRYQEVRVKDKINGVSGGCDGFVKTHRPKLRLIAVKSIDKDEFKALKAPMGNHRERTALYLKLLSNSDYASEVDCETAHLIYVAKSYGFKDETLTGTKDGNMTPIKEYLVHREDDLFEPKLALARSLKLWREKKGGMPVGVCANSFTPCAKSCPVVGSCFSGKFTAGM